MVIIVPNRAKQALAEGLINYGQVGTNQGSPHTFKVILMDTTFSFNKTTHGYLSDIETHALQEINGYNSKVINPLTLSFDINSNYNISFPTITWSATGGVIGPFKGAVIYDDNGALNTSKILIVHYLYTSPVTIEIGNSFSLYYGLIRI